MIIFTLFFFRINTFKSKRTFLMKEWTFSCFHFFAIVCKFASSYSIIFLTFGVFFFFIKVLLIIIIIICWIFIIIQNSLLRFFIRFLIILMMYFLFFFLVSFRFVNGNLNILIIIIIINFSFNLWFFVLSLKTHIADNFWVKIFTISFITILF